MTYERDIIRRMAGYAPGEQPADTGVIKLNTNENPWPPSPHVVDALAAVGAESLRRYPSPSAAAFLGEAAALHGVSAEQLVATNGGDELLRLAITTFVPPGRPIAIAEPSYSLYPVLAAIHDSPVHRITLDDDWSLPGGFAEELNDANVPLTLLVNPHAPSGRLLDAATIATFASALKGVLLVDEAYVDFADPGHDVVSLIANHDNLMILRTLSKGYSLAGLRLGYGIGPADLIRPIAAKTRDSYSVDAVADRLGAAALADQETARASWIAVRRERQRLTETLRDRGFEVPDSEANFCLARVPADAPASAATLHAGLKADGILVRHFDTPRLRDHLRISVGTPEQNDALLESLRVQLNR
ncbi:histidinol-phosphate transaminase [Spiribacter vilamensis]|uniref:Histidinol-phosphate aminotransferase n=1 Tax=Spiribacter vilamensis TaxID=531306 RepID=A0A4Q8CYZ3_9GAMM|nr:histidinol-phosphate transaminase [Spiribacter vilamensis]RZU98120.1 histidinol-phosphate aminotransferase [Spiribacter vilamensis]TVO60978.1 histidinol-phosphate transaminase [Spiribacter vilamensis]